MFSQLRQSVPTHIAFCNSRFRLQVLCQGRHPGRSDVWPGFFFVPVCSWVHMPTAQLFVQPCCSGVTPLETRERIRPRHLKMERVPVTTGCMLTLSRKVRARAKVKTNTREVIARPARPTRALQTSTRARTAANLDNGRKTAGIPGKSKHTGKGKGKHVDVVETEQLSFLRQPQPCRILRKILVLLENSRALQVWTRGSWV